MNAMKLAIPLFVALAYGPAQALAAPILGSDLATFAVLGSSDVTSANVSTFGGNVGSDPTAPTSAVTNYSFTFGSLQPGTQGTAQTQLDAAILAVNAFAPGTLITGGDLDAWQISHGGSIIPGTYELPATTTNLVGNLVLDGGGSNTAQWHFLVDSTLVTGTSSNVSVTNVGNGAGVGLYWTVGSAATLDGPTFAGNVLASAAITTDGDLTIGCGRLLSATSSVALNGVGSHISIGCGAAGDVGFGSGGFDQGVGIGAPVPEPEIYAMMGIGLALMGFVARRRKLKVAH